MPFKEHFQKTPKLIVYETHVSCFGTFSFMRIKSLICRIAGITANEVQVQL